MICDANTNLQPNICDLLNAYQTYPSHWKKIQELEVRLNLKFIHSFLV